MLLVGWCACFYRLVTTVIMTNREFLSIRWLDKRTSINICNKCCCFLRSALYFKSRGTFISMFNLYFGDPECSVSSFTFEATNACCFICQQRTPCSSQEYLWILCYGVRKIRMDIWGKEILLCAAWLRYWSWFAWLCITYKNFFCSSRLVFGTECGLASFWFAGIFQWQLCYCFFMLCYIRNISALNLDLFWGG